jgi:hypothetical protein
VFTEATPEPIRSEVNYCLGGAAWADFDNDGDLDVFFAGLNTSDGSPEHFYISNGDGTFSRWSGQPATFEVNLPSGWMGGEAWGDFDNDGYLDLLAGGDRLRLWRNLGNGSFEEIPAGSLTSDPLVSMFGFGWVDFNNDGFLDLFAANRSGNVNYLYMNNGSTNHWLEVKLVGTASDRLAVGAKIFATATIRGQVMRQMRVITASKADQTLVAHFGLGDATNIDLLRVEWPSGNVQELVDVTPDRLLSVTEQTLITPARPSVSVNGSVRLNRTSVAGATYQWQFNGVNLLDQTNRTLNLTNVVADQQGRYSVVASNVTTITTNYVYLHVDTTFTKITTGPVVAEAVNSITASWADYDNDGHLDLLAANASWSGTQFPCSLFHNNQDGTFTKVTTGTLPTRTRDSFIGAWGDYNNDGLPDLYVANSGTQADDLYRNDGGGALTRIVPPAGGDVGRDTADGYSAVWGDYDNDGIVDLLVANWSSENVLLYHNNGDGTFTKMTTNQVGPLVADRFRSTCAAWGDYDADGDLDLFVSNGVGTSGNTDRKNRLYRNLGNGMFERVTDGPVAADGGSSDSGAWVDYDNDGWLDLFVGSSGSTNLLYRNLGDGSLTAITNSILAQPASKGWQGAWGDYDNDGWLDVFIARGANGANALFHNNGNGLFTKITTGSLVTDTATSMCATWGDYDNDGSLDLFVANGNDIERNSLYRNNGNRNYWVKVKLVGTTSNRSGVGAKVRVRATVYGRSLWQLREISGGGGFEGGQGLIAHFGLGNATQVVTLRVEWPSGTAEEFANIAANQSLTIVEPSLGGAFAADGLFHVTMTGNTNNNYQLSVSSDLVNWTTLTNCAGPGPDGTIEVCDPVPGQAQRFYRLGPP